MSSRRRAFWWGVIVLWAVVGLRWQTEADVVPVAAVVVAPLLVAASSTPPATAGVGLAALLVALVLELDDGWQAASLPRLLVVAAVTVVGVGVAAERERRDGELARRRAEAATTRRLELALDAGAMGTWFYDSRSGVTVWDERLEALHGLAPGSYDGSFESWIGRVDPDDRERVLAASDDAIATGASYEVVYRVALPDGTPRWLEARGEPVTDRRGTRGTAGVVIDVTDQMVAAAELEEARQAARQSLAERNQLGSSLQENLLPTPRVTPERIDVVTYYQPGERYLLVGGDFFDVLERGDAVHFLIGDVSGHSAYAAAVGTALRAGWRALALHEEGEPARWLGELQLLLETETDDPECFATICTGSLRGGRLRVATAGHPAPILLDQAGAESVPLAAAPPVGIALGSGLAAGESPFEQVELTLPHPFSLFLYTDGAIEGRAAPGGTELFGEDGLRSWLSPRAGGSLDADDLRELAAALRSANGGPLSDDVTVVVLQTPRAGDDR